ncbi:toprim domain-containing protein [Halalkalibacter sp. APA_J-10(15)]|uniref:toprim domain-containing protein n=1 Tax=unclassified Halalkalibacter TaxID=2893063 RepID=UPI001FF2BAA0|nr:toprim domain-containing protein [Halalkalibacter sp. APA_J-10(15)]MCK0471077.1 toprim domain-containing protein [Halalkalibacter sp. APA_J-10(15)]
MVEKVLIVEGTNDRKRVKKVLHEKVTIICTHGTLSNEKLEEFILPIENEDVYVLVDADDSGDKIRKQLKRELPNAVHLYTIREYGQVETTPLDYLAQILRAHFQVKEKVEKKFTSRSLE